MAAAGLRPRLAAAVGLAGTAAVAPWGRAPADREGPRPRRPLAAQVRSLAISALQLPLASAAAGRVAECRVQRTTTVRELDHIHEEDFTKEMREVAGSVDFRGILEESCSIFRGVAPHVIERLVFGQKVFARRGTVLIEEGQENSAVFVVGHGTLSVHVGDTHVTTVNPGQVTGLMAMFKNSQATATVRVESEMAYLLVLRHQHFMACLDNNPEVFKRLQLLVEERELQNNLAEGKRAAKG